MYDINKYEEFIDGKDSTPFIEIVSKFEHSNFNKLLGQNETYNESNTDKIFVKLEDKLKQIYEAIFIKNYMSGNYYTTIGCYKFDANTKELVMRTINLFSQYTDIEIDE